MKNKKIAYIQWLRIFAAFAVVLMHTAAEPWYRLPVDSPEWQVLTHWDGLVRWPVPVFIMITGALFLPRKTELKTVLKRYIPRLVVAWLVWSWLYAANSGKEGEELWNEFFTGHYHLWYLPYLCGVYLTMPFLQRIAEDDRLTKQLLGVCAVVALAVPWLADAGAVFLPEYAVRLRAVENHLNFAFFFDQLALVLLGHVLNRTDFRPPVRRCIYAAGILAVAVTGAATIWVSELTGKANTLFFDYAGPTGLCAAVALFVFAKYNLTRLPKVVNRMAKYSFGIYLCHAFVLERLAEMGYDALTWGPVWGVPVLAVGVFAISLAVTAVIAKIPFVGKYLT